MQTTLNNSPHIADPWYFMQRMTFSKDFFFSYSPLPRILKMIIPSLWTLWIPDELGLCHMYMLWWILKWHQLKYWHATFGMGIEKQFRKKTIWVYSQWIFNAALTPLITPNTLTSIFHLPFSICSHPPFLWITRENFLVSYSCTVW